MKSFGQEAGLNATMGLLVALITELQSQGILDDPAIRRVIAGAKAGNRGKPTETEMNTILDYLIS